MTFLITKEDCVEILTRYSDKDNAEDIKLIPYQITENEIIIWIKYKTVMLKCVIDKAELTDIDKNMLTSEQFIEKYLKPKAPFNQPFPVIEIVGKEDKTPEIKISVSQE